MKIKVTEKGKPVVSDPEEGTSSSSKPILPQDLTPAVKGTITLCLLISFLAYGFSRTAASLSMFGLTETLHTTIAKVAIGYSVITFSSAVGALIYGIAADYGNRQLGLTLGLTVASFAYFATPLLANFTQYIVNSVVLGIADALIEVSAVAWMLELWSGKSGPYLFALTVMQRFGSAVASLLPFLKPGIISGPVINQVKIANKTAATIMFAAVAVMAVLFSTRKYNQVKRTLSQEKDNGQSVKVVNADGSTDSGEKKGSVGAKVALVFLAMFLLTNASTTNSNLNSFIYQYVKGLGMEEMTQMTQVGFIASTLALIVFSLMAIKLDTVYFLYVSGVLQVIGNAALLYANTTFPSHRPFIWAGIILCHIANGAVFPALLSYLEKNMNVTNWIVGLLTCLSSMAAMTPGFFAYRFERNESILTYSGMTSGGIVLALTLLIHLIAKRMNK